MVQPPFEIFLVPTWLRVPIWSGTCILGGEEGEVLGGLTLARTMNLFCLLYFIYLISTAGTLKNGINQTSDD